MHIRSAPPPPPPPPPPPRRAWTAAKWRRRCGRTALPPPTTRYPGFDPRCRLRPDGRNRARRARPSPAGASASPALVRADRHRVPGPSRARQAGWSAHNARNSVFANATAAQPVPGGHCAHCGPLSSPAHAATGTLRRRSPRASGSRRRRKLVRSRAGAASKRASPPISLSGVHGSPYATTDNR